MEVPQKKPISVILKLNHFNELNGELGQFKTDIDRRNYIKDFFVRRYGHGSGRLDISQKTSKVKLSWFLPQYVPQAEKVHLEALTKAKNKNFKEAINHWVKAIALNSKDPDFYFNLGIAFFEIKNYKESIENLNVAINLCPIYFKAHLILGTVHLKVRQFEKSEKHLKESLIFLPDHALAYLNLGAVYSILKRYDEGIDMFNRTLELSPREIRAHFGLGKIYSIKGEVEKANQYFKNVVDFDVSGKLTNHAKRAMISAPLEGQVQFSEQVGSANVEKLYQEGYKAYLFTDYERSIQMYEAYLKSKPNDDFVAFALGEAYLRAGHILKAIESYKKAANTNSSKALYFKALAIAFNFLDKENEVIKYAKKAHQLGKTDSVLYALLGKALIKQNQLKEAIENLEKALKLNENNLLAKYHLGVAFLKNRDIDSAANYLQEIIRSSANSPIKMEAESLISKLKA